MAPAPAAAQSPARGLSDAERQLASRLEEPATRGRRATGIARLAETAAGRARKSVVTDVSLLGSPGTSAPAERYARVTRYEYASGLTFMTVVDLSTGTVLDVRAEANRPTPLADEEIEHALALAGQAVVDLAAPPRPGVQTLPLIDSVATSPRHGHRLVLVWRDRPVPSRRVLVDLTTDQVADPNF
jgi:hypothetical protein